MWGLFLSHHLSPHICRENTIIILPGSWLCFLDTAPGHTRCICFPLRREAFSITLFSPQRNVPPTDDTDLLVNNLPKRYKICSPSSARKLYSIFFFTRIKKKKSGWESYKIVMEKAPLGKKSKRTFASSLQEVARNWSPKVMHKIPQFDRRALWVFPLGCWIFFFFFLSIFFF